MSSSGPAGEKQSSLMGVYRQSGDTQNKKPVWSSLEGNAKVFYSNGKLTMLMIMMMIIVLCVSLMIMIIQRDTGR